ncbi:MAG: methyltransferase [Armatimonadota bacterium]
MQPPPHVEVFSLCASMIKARAVWAAAQLGIADHVGTAPVSVDALADATKTHSDTLYRVLRLLAANGIFHESEGRCFAHTPQSESLRSDHPTKTRAAVLLLGGIDFWNAFARLDRSVETGESGWRMTQGMGFFDWLPNHPEAAPIFNDAMVGIHGGEPPAVAEAYPFAGTVVDVGGGSGNMLVHILGRHADATGVLFDLPHVADAARANLLSAGLADRCTVRTGNFFEGVPEDGDVYVLSHIVHDWDEDSCVRILSHCAKAKKAGGKVLLVEMVVPGPNEPHPAKELDLVMLAVPGGRERTVDEYAELFGKAGLRLTRVVPTMSPDSVLEAE